jgi:CubicO group peptidase (beta-lactamase class C family)
VSQVASLSIPSGCQIRCESSANDKSKFTSWSVAKSFTSTLVGLALADGKIKSIDEPVTNYLPELKGSGYEGVPIKDILEMSSGVKFNEEYGKPESDVMIMWRKTMDESETFADYAKSLGRAEAPRHEVRLSKRQYGGARDARETRRGRIAGRHAVTSSLRGTRRSFLTRK